LVGASSYSESPGKKKGGKSKKGGSSALVSVSAKGEGKEKEREREGEMSDDPLDEFPSFSALPYRERSSSASPRKRKRTAEIEVEFFDDEDEEEENLDMGMEMDEGMGDMVESSVSPTPQFGEGYSGKILFFAYISNIC
jgi:hypothetical protein